MNGKKRPTAIRCCQPFHDVMRAVANRFFSTLCTFRSKKLFTFHDVMSAVANRFFSTLCTFRSKKLFTFHSSLFTAERPIAHARGGAQCRDDGGDDAADDLEDGLPRFLVFHGIRCFLVG